LSISCKNNDDPLPAIEKPVCQLISVVTGLNERHYEYNDDEQLIKSIESYNNYAKFEYKNDRVARVTYYRDDDESKVYEIDRIEYNSKGQWIKHTYELDNIVLIAEYNAAGNRTMITQKMNGKLTEIYVFEYLDGNMMKQTIDHYDIHESLSYSSFYTYAYDLNTANKLTYFESLVRFGYNEVRLGRESTPSKNMLKTVNTLSWDGSEVSVSANFEYEYNDKGFPTKLTISGGDLNGDGNLNENDILVYPYEYNCL